MFVEGCVIVTELDDPSGHHDFPWMALHCNFQGLVAESDSDRDPGNSCFLRGQRRVCAALLPSGCYLKAQVNFTLAAVAHALNNGQNILWVQLVDMLMIDAGCTDVMWPHAWNFVCGSSHRHFLLVCERLVNNIQSGISDPAAAPAHSDSESVGAPQLHGRQSRLYRHARVHMNAVFI